MCFVAIATRRMINIIYKDSQINTRQRQIKNINYFSLVFILVFTVIIVFTIINEYFAINFLGNFYYY